VILPVVELLLFTGETYHSVRTYREGQRSSGKYFWWSSIRLDSDPLDRRPHAAAPYKESVENCTTWDLRSIYVDPGLLTMSLMLTGLPAIAVAKLLVAGLGRFGVNQIWSFMISMPPLLVAWYYLLGWFVDRWKFKPRHRT
jgi:hypothetical protein